ncbi:response regulator, partial [Candidatus Woesearchaeota archaeon]|nr:response regulator [Candidatus Woesearchaeota archaeon]
LDLINSIISKQNLVSLNNALSRENLVAEYNNQNPGLIILDNNIPPGGSEVLKQLVSMNNAIRVLMLCRQFQKELYLNLIELGAKDALFIPFSEDRINIILKCLVHPYLQKYADVMVPYMVAKLTMMGANRFNLVAKMTGGAQMFPNVDNEELKIGQRNIAKTTEILKAMQIRLLSEEVGGSVGRTAVYDVNTEKYLIKTKDMQKEI